MEKSKELLKQANIVPDLQLATQMKDEAGNSKGVQGTGPHKVKILEDKLIKVKEYNSESEVPGVRYYLEEDGSKKKYDVPVKDKSGELHYLIQRLADVKEGEEIILEYKRHGVKGYIEVKAVIEEEGEEEKIISADDGIIPVIEDKEPVIEDKEPDLKDIPF